MQEDANRIEQYIPPQGVELHREFVEIKGTEEIKYDGILCVLCKEAAWGEHGRTWDTVSEFLSDENNRAKLLQDDEILHQSSQEYKVTSLMIMAYDDETGCGAPYEVVKKLIDLDPKIVSKKDDFNRLPIHHFAARHRNEDTLLILELLVEKNPDSLTAQDNRGSTPLHDAFRLATIPPTFGIVKTLIGIKQNAMMKIDEFGCLPLHLACTWGVPNEIIMILVRAYPESLTICDGQSRLPLDRLGSEASRVKPIMDKYVREHPGILELRDTQGRTPLHRAFLNPMHNPSLDAVNFLITRSNAKAIDTAYERLPLHYASENNAPLDVLMCLVNSFKTAVTSRAPVDQEKKAFTSVDKNGSTPVHCLFTTPLPEPLLTKIARLRDNGDWLVSLVNEKNSGILEVGHHTQLKAEQIFQDILHGSTLDNSVEFGENKFHYIVRDGICYLAMFKSIYTEEVAFIYLNDVQEDFTRKMKDDLGSNWVNQNLSSLSALQTFEAYRPCDFQLNERILTEEESKDFPDPNAVKFFLSSGCEGCISPRYEKAKTSAETEDKAGRLPIDLLSELFLAQSQPASGDVALVKEANNLRRGKDCLDELLQAYPECVNRKIEKWEPLDNALDDSLTSPDEIKYHKYLLVVFEFISHILQHERVRHLHNPNLETSVFAKEGLCKTMVRLPYEYRIKLCMMYLMQRLLQKRILEEAPVFFLTMDCYMLVLLLISFHILVTNTIDSRWPLSEAGESPHCTGATVGISIGLAWLIIRVFVKVSTYLVMLNTMKFLVSDFENYVDLACLGFVVAVVGMAYTSKNIEEQTFKIIASISTAFLWLKVMLFLKRIRRNFAVFVDGMVQIVRSVFTYLIVLAIVIIAFGQMLSIMYQNDPGNDTDDFDESVLTVYTLALGAVEDEEWKDPFTVFLLAMYALLVTIILLSVLIVLLQNIYTQIEAEKAEMIFWSSRVVFCAEIDLMMLIVKKLFKRNCSKTPSANLSQRQVFPSDHKDNPLAGTDDTARPQSNCSFVWLAFANLSWLLFGCIFGMLWPKWFKRRLLDCRSPSPSKTRLEKKMDGYRDDQLRSEKELNGQLRRVVEITSKNEEMVSLLVAAKCVNNEEANKKGKTTD